ncbi:hypothetical protein AB3X55_13295 [Alphaproteobacteria bacterium LSUCC0719]
MANRYLLHFFLFFAFAIGAQSTLASEAAYTCKFEIEKFWQDAKPSTRKGKHITASGDAVIDGVNLRLQNVLVGKRASKRVEPSLIEKNTSLTISESGGISGHLTIHHNKSGKRITDFHISNPAPPDDPSANPPIKGVFIDGNTFKVNSKGHAVFTIRRSEWIKYTGNYTRYEFRLIDCLGNLKGHVAQLAAQDDTIKSGIVIPSDDSREKLTATTSNSVVEPSNSESQVEIDEQISSLLKETQSLKAQLSEATNLASARLQSIQDLEDQLAELRKAADVSTSDSERNAELTQQITQMTQMLLDREQKIKELNEKVAALEDSSSDVNEAINTKLMQMVAKLETSQASLIAELDEAKVALEAEEAKVASLSALEQQVASCEADKVRTIEELNAKQSNVVSALKEKIAQYAVDAAMCETSSETSSASEGQKLENGTSSLETSQTTKFNHDPLALGLTFLADDFDRAIAVKKHSRESLQGFALDAGFEQRWLDDAWNDPKASELWRQALPKEEFAVCRNIHQLDMATLEMFGFEFLGQGTPTKYWQLKIFDDALRFREIQLVREIGKDAVNNLRDRTVYPEDTSAFEKMTRKLAKRCYGHVAKFTALVDAKSGGKLASAFSSTSVSTVARAPGCVDYHDALLSTARSYFNIPNKKIKDCNRELGFSRITFDDYSSVLHWGENVIGYKSSQLGNYQCIDLFTKQRFYGSMASCRAR